MTTRVPFLLVAAAALTAVVPSGATSEDAPNVSKKLVEALKGKWQLTSRIADGAESDADLVKNRTMVVGDGKYTLYNGKDEFLTTSFKVDATKKPHHFDLPDPDQQELGIIKLDGDTLTICIGPKGGPRATEFKSPEGKDWVLVTYQRVK